MTQSQYMRLERRKARLERAQKERMDRALAIVGLVMLLLVFGLAGTLDYQDRTQGIGAEMPTAGWHW